jgi:hypothetical protein
LQQFRHQSGPARLVRCADAPAGVAVEIFMKQDVVPEVGVAVQLRVVSQSRTKAALIAQENAREAAGQFIRHLVDRQEVARAGRTLDLEIIAVVVVKLLQRLDQKIVDWGYC